MELLSPEPDVCTTLSRDVCLCCLARNVQFVSLAKCKHTSVFEFLFRSKFQFKDSVVCYECHYHLNKIDLFRAQVQETQGLLWKKWEYTGIKSIKFQNFTVSPIDITSIIGDIHLHTEPNFERNSSTDTNSKQPRYNLTAVVKVERDEDGPYVNEEVVQNNSTKDAESIQAQTKDLTQKIKVDVNSIVNLEVEQNANFKQSQYTDLTFDTPTATQTNSQNLIYSKKEQCTYVDNMFIEIQPELEQSAISHQAQTNDFTTTIKVEPSNFNLETEQQTHYHDLTAEIKVEPCLDDLGTVYNNLTTQRDVDGDLEQAKYAGLPVNIEDESDSESDVESDTIQCEVRKGIKQKRNLEPRVRASAEQLTKMLEFMESHRDLALGQLWRASPRRAEDTWEELTVLLNSVCERRRKTRVQWKKAWSDWRSKTKRKALMNPPEHTKLEQRLWALISGEDTQQIDSDPLNPLQCDDPTSKCEVEISSDYSETSYNNNMEGTYAYLENSQYNDLTTELIEEDYSDSDVDDTGQCDVRIGKRKRKVEPRVRASSEQLTKMLEFMESHRDLALGRLWRSSPQGAEELWEELTVLLNSVSRQRSKTRVQWKKAWSDWRGKTKRKALMDPPEHTKLEQRLWALISGDYAQQDGDMSEQNTTNPAGTQQNSSESDESDDENAVKRIRKKLPKATDIRARSSQHQLNTMVEFMESNGDAPLWKNEGRVFAEQMWENLAGLLNSLEGCKGPVEKWKKAWTDCKSKTKRKVLYLQEQNGDAALDHLTNFERRVWAVLTKPHFEGDELTNS